MEISSSQPHLRAGTGGDLGAGWWRFLFSSCPHFSLLSGHSQITFLPPCCNMHPALPMDGEQKGCVTPVGVAQRAAPRGGGGQ